jgi:WD40 repeat protein
MLASLNIEENQHDNDNPDAGALVHLASSGRLTELTTGLKTRKEHGGLVCILQNYAMRGRRWKIVCSTSSPISGDFAVADDRGQVYGESVEENNYKLIRSASAPVASMCYIPCRRNQLLVSYENGQVVLIDTSTKEILANLQTENGSAPPVRLIKAHPTKAIVVLAGEDGCVSGKFLFSSIFLLVTFLTLPLHNHPKSGI